MARSQSAMEYLMTYGWAILIIAVVLASLYFLGVFNAGSSVGAGNPCVGEPGFVCTQVFVSQGGILSFNLAPTRGSNLYNTSFSCSSSANALSASQLPFNAIQSTGNAFVGSGNLANVIAAYNSVELLNDETYQISGIQCYGATGASGSMLSPIGTSFTGSIWMAYTPSGCTGSGSCSNIQYVQVARVNLKSSS